jgi:WD40 repeat protein
LAFSPYGQLLASGGGDESVRLWDLSSGQSIKLPGTDFPVYSIAFSSDGKILGAAGAGLKFWNVASRNEVELIKTDTSSVRRVAFSPHGWLLATLDKDDRVVVWDADNGSKEATFEDEFNGTTSLVFSGDGRLIALGQQDGRIALCDVAKQADVRWIQGHTGEIRQVAFTPDAKTLASASYDSTVTLWNVATGQPALTVKHRGPATGVCFSASGMLMATCGADGTARVWRAASLNDADAEWSGRPGQD